MDNRKVMLEQLQEQYQFMQVLNYEETPVRCYMRFIHGSNMYIAEKTVQPNTIINIYSLERSITGYEG